MDALQLVQRAPDEMLDSGSLSRVHQVLAVLRLVRLGFRLNKVVGEEERPD